VAANKNGAAQGDSGGKKDKGYCKKDTKGLRGRKLFWHHRGLEHSKNSSYWQPFQGGILQSHAAGRPLEYIRTGQDQDKRCDSQNRSIKRWIEPGHKFSFRIHLQNATDEELGALLWLLPLPKECYFRLGYGKPLGFGSLRLALAGSQVAKGEYWKSSYYNSLFGAQTPPSLDDNQQKEIKKSFMAAMLSAYPLSGKGQSPSAGGAGLGHNPFAKLASVQVHGQAPEKSGKTVFLEGDDKRFEQLSFVAGFLGAAKGPAKDFPIHYPRLPEGESFKWFVENENGRKGPLKRIGMGCCLPHVTETSKENVDGSLPLDPTK
jgi:hypothetical protein